MKITGVKTLHCDAGWRVWSFLKVETDQGVVGWAEFNESYGSPGLANVIEKLAAGLIGADPRPVERHTAMLYAKTRQAPGGLIQQAIAAIENALVDVKARLLEIPVHQMLGGPVRDRLRLYWSHCGSYRLAFHDQIGCAPLTDLDGVARLAAEVRDKGFTALKTNIFMFGEDPFMFQPGFTANAGWPELNWDQSLLTTIDQQMAAFRDGGGDIDLLLDLNFNFKTEGYVRVAERLAKHDLMWLEIDQFDAATLRYIRERAPMAVASCESLFGRRQFRPFLETGAVDVAIIDVPWNGILESVKIASHAEACEINCAPHNFYGNLCTAMSAHFCATIPNFRIMEIDIDDVPWKDEIATPPVIENGSLVMTDAPGWGVEIDEDAIKRRPPK